MLSEQEVTLPENRTHYRLEKLGRLVEISLILNSTLDLDSLLGKILETAAELLECRDVSILLFDENREELRFVAATGSEKKELEKIPVPLDSSLAGTIYQENRPLLINRVESDPRHYNRVAEEVDYQVDSLVGVPMRVKQRVIGVLEGLNKKEEEGFTPLDVDLLMVIASQAAVAIDKAKLIQALRKANTELNEADKMKRAFMAVASHELRTPLGVILGYASFLQDDASGESKQYAKYVLKAAIRLRSILDDMKNMNLLYTGEADLNIQPIDLEEIIAVAKRETLPIAEAKNHEITFQLPSKPISLLVDGEKIGMVLINLLNNAIKFTPPGGKINFEVSEKKEKIYISVQDSGQGIPAEKQDRIFDGFYQVENHMTRKSGGLGVGLSIAREIVNLHGGKIWVESKGSGHGATFFVNLPKKAPGFS